MSEKKLAITPPKSFWGAYTTPIQITDAVYNTPAVELRRLLSHDNFLEDEVTVKTSKGEVKRVPKYAMLLAFLESVAGAVGISGFSDDRIEVENPLEAVDKGTGRDAARISPTFYRMIVESIGVFKAQYDEMKEDAEFISKEEFRENVKMYHDKVRRLVLKFLAYTDNAATSSLHTDLRHHVEKTPSLVIPRRARYAGGEQF